MKKLLDCSDEELVALAQTILNKYKKALTDAKTIAVEYGFEIGESENKLLNTIFAKLKDKRDTVSKESVEPAYKKAVFELAKQGKISTIPELVSLFESQDYSGVRNMLLSLDLFWEKRKTNKYKEERKEKAAAKRLKVIFPDGKVISHPKAAQTLLDIVEYIGFERVESLNWTTSGQPFVSRDVYPRCQQERDGWYVTSHSSTAVKRDQIKKLSEIFNLGLDIEEI